ncbi:hypothetical protein AAA799E16_00855 [Marine Group I thaumarchaeote SCGC AAA799-E16]|uniref:Uncharacterized protein n=2 Tax=Marine Group I TaxID=905826 RepID=A0A087RZQ2_9ARCH|nr:hypothetical protein AAA799E16_00855 [Marine Group I thaumarchaeote SCGC AAA799-E16]KFM18956.1 hypothetical protein SCCGRSA3_00848 [Marine Group I thaumarchaeote SCGC RSA3]
MIQFKLKLDLPKIMQKRFATIFLATTLIAVMMVGLQIESVDAKKAQGTYNQKYGKANAGIVCGDRLCSEVNQGPNVSDTGKYMAKSDYGYAMMDDSSKKHGDSMKDHSYKKQGSSSDSITGAILKNNIFDGASGTVTVVIDAFDDGSIKINVPQLSTVDMVLVDGEEWDDAYVHGNMVKVYFYAGTEKIEIIGN